MRVPAQQPRRSPWRHPELVPRRAGSTPSCCTPSFPRLSARPRCPCFPAAATRLPGKRTTASPSLGGGGQGKRGWASWWREPACRPFGTRACTVPGTRSHPRAQLPPGARWAHRRSVRFKPPASCGADAARVPRRLSHRGGIGRCR